MGAPRNSMETHHSFPHTLSYVSFIQLSFLLNFLFIYLFNLAVLGLRGCAGSSLVSVLGLLFAVASLVAKHGL